MQNMQNMQMLMQRLQQPGPGPGPGHGEADPPPSLPAARLARLPVQSGETPWVAPVVHRAHDVYRQCKGQKRTSAYTATLPQTGAVAPPVASDAQRCPVSPELQSAFLPRLPGSLAPWTSGFGKLKLAARSHCLLQRRPRSSHQTTQKVLCHW